MIKAEELKFQVELARIQINAGVLIGIGTALAIAGITVFIGILNVNEKSTVFTTLQVSAFLIGSGYIVVAVFAFVTCKQLNQKMKEAERFKTETTTSTGNYDTND
jgi:hypothetical protein